MPRPLLARALAVIVLLAGGAVSAEELRPWEWRGSFGGEFGSTSHGTFDLGVRRGPFVIELLSDTLEVRWAPESATGRWWVALRGEAIAAGLMISPWTNGKPDPSRDLYAGYLGGDAGWIHYVSPLYLGVHGMLREYFFAGNSDTTIAVPDPATLATLEAVVGRYVPGFHVWMRGGVDVRPGAQTVLQPHLAGEATIRPELELAPAVELRAGWASGQDFITLTRVGGLNPYVVPVAGAGWAEWWVQNYVAARLGINWRGPRLELGALADVAIFDSGFHAGFAVRGGWHQGRYSLDAELGYAPWIARGPEVDRISFYLLAAMAWGKR